MLPLLLRVVSHLSEDAKSLLIDLITRFEFPLAFVHCGCLLAVVVTPKEHSPDESQGVVTADLQLQNGGSVFSQGMSLRRSSRGEGRVS